MLYLHAKQSPSPCHGPLIFTEGSNRHNLWPTSRIRNFTTQVHVCICSYSLKAGKLPSNRNATAPLQCTSVGFLVSAGMLVPGHRARLGPSGHSGQASGAGHGVSLQASWRLHILDASYRTVGKLKKRCMAWNGIPWLGRLRQLLSNILPMRQERASAMIPPTVAQPTSGTSIHPAACLWCQQH